MTTFEEHFSDEGIIRELCKARIKWARDRHKALFFRNISKLSKGPEEVPPDHWGEIPEDIFPPRRKWHRFRRRIRGVKPSITLNQESLFYAVMTLRKLDPKAPWVDRLHSVIEHIRGRALSVQSFEFTRPQIKFKEKDPSKKTYRALAVYILEDKVIDCITARYLRRLLDCCLYPCSIAFRCSKPIPSIHTALESILDARNRWDRHGIYVAECDIKGFFDCVSHSVAKRCLDNLITELNLKYPSRKVDARALNIFDAYLNSYSFEESVWESTQGKRLREIDALKWHRDSLTSLHAGSELPRIGVPQGGALSCLIANAVLHAADTAVLKQRPQPYEFLYLRYCDDMIIMTFDQALCARMFSAYQEALRGLKLPAHPPEPIGSYLHHDHRRAFWAAKSKSTYIWDIPTSPNTSPWIQFVGYQIRRDGLVRIRRASLQKEHRKIKKTADDLLAVLNRGRREYGRYGVIRSTKYEIMHRFRQKLISMAVGRVRLGVNSDQLLPMCWTNGFAGLKSRPILLNGIKALDHSRERQLKRVFAALDLYDLPQHKREVHSKQYRFYGGPFSYCRRFLG